MAINFEKQRWDKIKADADKWWAGQLQRPLIQVRLKGREPGRQQPAIPYYNFTSFYDLAVPAEQIVDRWDYELCCTEFMGDAFPYVRPNFGAVPVAAFIGATLKNGNGTVWFYPKQDLPITDINFQPDKNDVWCNRTIDIINAAIKRWDGFVQIALDIGAGNIDILSIFRPGEKLLLDLYDHPQDVERLVWQSHDLWWKYLNQFQEILQPINPGCSGWAFIFSNQLYYMLQSDFSYMISPDMFEKFIKPELQATAKRLGNAFYHLDGPGALTHLDSLLEIEEIKGIQWIPGDGQPDISKWPDVFRKIRDAGKLIQFFDTQYQGGFEIMDILADQLGSAEGIIYIGTADISQQDEVQAMLEKYDAV